MLKNKLIDRLLLNAAETKTLVDLRTVVRAQYSNWPTAPAPPYVEISMTSESEITKVRNAISKHLVSIYHRDVGAGSLPLSALFVGEKTQLPGPPLRQLVETTRGSPFASDSEWLTYWSELVRALYVRYGGG
jgi:hypothetical protein